MAPDGLARRAADHVSPRARAGDGASEAGVRLGAQKPIYDVIARLHGPERPDEWVIRGNHHDAWVNGAEDPLSGQVAMLAEAEAIGALVEGRLDSRSGRSSTAAWDGEEPGLLGSTEWAETHAESCSRRRSSYINSDGNGARLSRRRRIAHARTIRQRSRAAMTDPADQRDRLANARRARRSSRGHRGRPQGGARPAGIAHRRARFRLRLHAVPRSTSASRRSTIGFGGEDRRRRLPFDLRLVHSLRALRRSRTSPTRSSWRRPAAARCCASPTRTWLPISARLSRDGRQIRAGGDQAHRDGNGTRSPTATSGFARRPMSLAADPKETYVAPAPEAAGAVPEL